MSLIDREALIAEYDRVHVGAPGGARKLMVDAPEVKPEPNWIPVTERLPELRRSVILSTKNWTGEGCCWEMIEHYVIWKGYRWNATYRDGEVIAWMPLPEPYRGEEQDD